MVKLSFFATDLMDEKKRRNNELLIIIFLINI